MYRGLPLFLALAGCAPGPASRSTVGEAVLGAVPPASRASAVETQAQSKVLLVVIVDQLGSWVLQQRLSQLSAQGAFVGLMRSGLYAPELRYEHATTSTAPGHA